MGLALADVLKDTPFKVFVVESRLEWAEKSRALSHVTVLAQPWESVVEAIPWEEELTHCVVMTHSHDQDLALIRVLTKKPHKYLGLIGSTTKKKRFEQKLLADGSPGDFISSFVCPIGLPIGGKSPQEVAVSCAAELLSLHYKTEGLQQAEAIKEGSAS